MNKTKKIAVIGAGPSGSAAAYYLTNNGYEVDVFEKENFIGGRTHVFDNGETRFDTGASFFTNFYPLLLSLIKELNLDHEVLELKRRVGLREKETLAEFAFGDIKTFWNLPFLSFKDKTTMIWKTLLLTLQRRKLDLVDPKKLAAIDDESIANWARNYLTENVYEYCIKPGVEPFWYFSCEDVSRAMTTVLQGRAADAKFYTFKNGMASISSKLLENSSLQLNSAVSKIEKNNSQFLVTYQNSTKETSCLYDGIVMACPTPQIKKILPENLIPSYIKDFINSQQYVSNLHATYLVDEKETKGSLAYYYPCGKWETPIAAIVLHKIKAIDSIKAPKGKELISVYIMDHSTNQLNNLEEKEIFSKVWVMAKDFQPSLPADYIPVAIFNRENAIPLHQVGRYSLANKIKDAQNGNLVFAGDYLSCATVEGAIRSGRWAAFKLMNKEISTF